MKKYLFVTFIFIIFLSLSCSKKILKETTKVSCLECEKYKVNKISEEGTVNIIELSRNDSLFRVLTIHYKNPVAIYSTEIKNEDCETELIKIGELYPLKLDSLYKYETKKDFVYSLDIHHYIEFNGSNIDIKDDETLYTTKSLNGLCLVYSKK